MLLLRQHLHVSRIYYLKYFVNVNIDIKFLGKNRLNFELKREGKKRIEMKGK